MLLRFTQKKVKLLTLSIFISFYFLFSFLAVFAAWEEDVLEISDEIETMSSSNFDLEEQRKYAFSLSHLRSGNRHLIKKGLKDLITKITEKIHSSARDTFWERMLNIQGRLIFIQKEIEQEPIYNLRVRIEQYFREFFGDDFAGIEFFEKTGGIQLGQKVRITLRSLRNPIDYYVKTHRGGLLSPTMTSGSAGSSDVDPKELFVYRVFELIGLTPETHFFFGEGGAKNFYIATKDAGFDELAREQKPFVIYEKLKETTGASSHHAKISTIAERWDETLKKTLVAADLLEMDLSRVELNMIKGLSKADVLSRIFLLSDFITSGGNLGFVIDDSLSKFRVIDFVIAEVGGGYEAPGVFDGFLSGNGRHCYRADTDSFIRYILCNRHLAKRAQMARESLTELTRTTTPQSRLLNSETLDMARADVEDIIRRCPSFLNLDGALRDLNYYVEGVKANLKTFSGSVLYDDYSVPCSLERPLSSGEIFTASSSPEVFELSGVPDEGLLYTDERIQNLLELLLPERDLFAIIPPAATIFENIELLTDATRNALEAAFAGTVVVMPIHLHANHWVGAVFRRQANGAIQVIYNNPQGFVIDLEQNAVRFVETIQAIANEVTPGIAPDIIDLHLRQQHNGVDCGPFTVDNLVRIARVGIELDGLDRDRIIARAELQIPVDGNATIIRAQHDDIELPIPTETARYDSSLPSLVVDLSAPTLALEGVEESIHNRTYFPDEIIRNRSRGCISSSFSSST